jgi:hypothetical protein
MRPSPPSSMRSNLNTNPNLLARMHPSDAILAADLRRSAYKASASQAGQTGNVAFPPIAADADFEPANPPNQLSKRIIDYRLS